MEEKRLSALVKIITAMEHPDDEARLLELAQHSDAMKLIDKAQPSPALLLMMRSCGIAMPPRSIKKDFIGLLTIIIKSLIANKQNVELAALLKYIQEKNIQADGKSLLELNDNKFEYTPLLLAAAVDSDKCLAVLLKFGASKDALTVYNDLYNKANALIVAAQHGSLNCLKILLDKGMDPNAVDGENRTALWLACYGQHFECAELLLKRGANPNICDDFEGWSPLHFAQYHHNQKLHDLLFKHGASFEPLKSSNIRGLAVNGIPFVLSVPAASDAEIEKTLLAQRLGLEDEWEEAGSKEQPSKDEKKNSEVKLTDGSNLDKQLNNGVYAERMFFGITRQRKKETHELRRKLQEGRKTTAPKGVDVTGISARRFIAADAGGIKASIKEAGGEEKLTTSADIEQNLAWAKKEVKGPSSYNVQPLSHSGTRIAYKHTPAPGHLGGFYMFDTTENGKGTYDDIIKLINAITGKDPKKEAVLAKCMFNFAKTGQLAPQEELAKEGIKPTNSQYDCFKRVCFLTSIKEVVRRLVPSLQSNGRPTALFPFALTHYRALELIANGYLKMEEVFSADAPYGLAAGKNITSTEEGRKKAHEKIKRVNRLYNENILLKTHPEARNIILKGTSINSKISAFSSDSQKFRKSRMR